METVEYCINFQGHYIQESNKEGLYYKCNSIKEASTFPSVENALKFVQDDMKLNIRNVEIRKVVTSTTESVVEL